VDSHNKPPAGEYRACDHSSFGDDLRLGHVARLAQSVPRFAQRERVAETKTNAVLSVEPLRNNWRAQTRLYGRRDAGSRSALHLLDRVVFVRLQPVLQID